MKKLLLKTILLLCALIVGSGNVWATEDTATFGPSDFSGQGTSGSGSAISKTINGVTFACDKGYGTTQIRCYSGGKITISSSQTITAISFTFSGSSYSGGMETSYSGLSTTSWTNTLSSQARITEVTVTFETGGSGGDPTKDTTIGLVSTSGSTSYGTPISVGHSLTDGYTGTMSATVVPDIATVSISTSPKTITFTPKAVGKATITISAPANGDYKAATNETYTLTVTAPAGGTTAPAAPVEVWKETWDKTNGTGGNDGSWNGSIASSDVTADLTGWTYANQGGAKKCLKAGSSSKKGTATTPAFGEAGNMIVEFKAGAWDSGSEQTDLILSVTGGGTLSESSVSMTKGEFNDYAVAIKGATADTKLTFAGKNASNSRFFLDEVKVSEGELIYTKLNSQGYATFCSEYPLDFSGASDYTAWQITAANSSTGVITFSKITGAIKGGQGILLMGTANATVILTSSDSDNELSGNKLFGTTAPTYVAADSYYGLSGNEFVKVNAGTVPAGKALLPVEALDVKSFTFEFDDPTGITATRTLGNEDAAIYIYNMAGQRVSKTTKGIFIKNGRKFIVK